MQIEQFDTGLKGQENIKKLVITPEQNYNNKQKVKHYLKRRNHLKEEFPPVSHY